MVTTSESLESLPMVAPATDVPGPAPGDWTYADYAALPDDGRRYEIIAGVPYMTPSPNEAHQRASFLFSFHLGSAIWRTGRGRVYTAPLDVELAPGVVVQPDIVVVLTANLGVIRAERIVGAPDLIVEVLSPGTAGYDRRQKQDAYARAGVAEYWLADPDARTVELLRLEGEGYRSLGVYRGRAVLPSLVVPGLPARVEGFFA